ncbi:MAG: 3-dehydroquinate synthase, partial [Candidatus Eremiobacterota bacterium]
MRFEVPFEYPVLFTRGLFQRGNELLAGFVGRHRVLYVVEERFPLEVAPVLHLPGGERVKRRRFLGRILEAIHAAGLCRHSHVVAIGGGALLDVAGFAAAVAHRGVCLV